MQVRRGYAGVATLLMCVALVAGVVARFSGPSAADAASRRQTTQQDLVVVSDDWAIQGSDGCDALTIVSADDGRTRAVSNYNVSPGQLAANSTGSVIASLSSNAAAYVLVMLWRPLESTWKDARFDDDEHLALARGGAIAISPDDRVLLVAWANAVAKYSLANVSLAGLGPVQAEVGFPEPGQWRQSVVAGAIQFSADSRTAYVVATDGRVHVLDVNAMSWRGAPIPYMPTHRVREYRIRRTFASLSPDERWLVVNTANQQAGALNVIDTQKRVSASVEPEGLRETWGVRFNYADQNHGLLAVHGRSSASVYEFSPTALRRVASMAVPPQKMDFDQEGKAIFARAGALAWSGDGSKLIVNRGQAPREWRILELTAGESRRLRWVRDFDSCKSSRPTYNLGLDVISLQRIGVRATPTTTATPTPSPSVTTTSVTITASTTPRPTPTVTKTSPPPSALPAALFLPLTLREQCEPHHQRADIALVIDTSSSMTGRQLQDAKAAALLFVGMIDLEPGRSQVAVVRYDRESEVARELTRSRPLIEAAIRSLQVRSGTHIDKGLRAALGELQGPRHLDRNMPVMILLTDGLQTGTPGEEVRAADEVRNAGVRLYTIGLGSDVDDAALMTMAGDESRYYFAPDSGDLASIYAEIAQDLMCPGKELWGGR